MSSTQQFVIKRGQMPRIKIERDAQEPVRFAGHELTRYFRKILRTSKAKSPQKVIAIGIKPNAKLGEEGYEIVVSDDSVIINGGGPAGVVFGTYEFLRRYCGCRFSGPGPDSEYVPQKEMLQIPKQTFRQEPKLWYRGMQISGRYDPDLIIREIDWMAKNGMNYVLFHPRPEEREALKTVNPRARQPFTMAWFRQHIFPEVLRRGMKLDMNHHNLLTWLSPEKYFREHPEWYALVDGKRKPVAQLSICTSNREAVTTLIANVKRFISQNPEVSIIGVIPEDDGGMCQCEECRNNDLQPDDAFEPIDYSRKGKTQSQSKIRRYFRLVNEVAREVRKEFPNVLIGSGHYRDLQWPSEKAKLEDNVVPWIAMYGRCSSHDLSEQTCRKNDFFFDLLIQWKRTGVQKLILYEYYMGMYSQGGLPYPAAKRICREWPKLKKLGIQGATIQSNPTNLIIYGLNYLAFARSGWEDEVDYEKFLDDYLLGIFGTAAQAIKPVYVAFDRVVDQIERGEADDVPCLRSSMHGDAHLRPDGQNIIYFMDEIKVDNVRECIRRAKTVAANDRERRQIKCFENAVQYWRLGYKFHKLKLQVLVVEEKGLTDVSTLYAKCYRAHQKWQEYADRIPMDGWTEKVVYNNKSDIRHMLEKADIEYDKKR